MQILSPSRRLPLIIPSLHSPFRVHLPHPTMPTSHASPARDRGSRPIQVKVYVSPAEHRQLKRVAKARGENVSVCIREFIKHEYASLAFSSVRAGKK